MNKNELKRVLQHRMSKFNHILKKHPEDLEDAQRHQFVGAMNEISVILRALECEE